MIRFKSRAANISKAKEGEEVETGGGGGGGQDEIRQKRSVRLTDRED